MSRIGKKYITMPQKVKVTLERQKISVDGPKGSYLEFYLLLFVVR